MGLNHSRARDRKKIRQSRGGDFVSVPTTSSSHINEDSLGQQISDNNFSTCVRGCSSSSPTSSHPDTPTSSSIHPHDPSLQLSTVSNQNSHPKHDTCLSCAEDSKIHCQIDYIHCLVPDLLAISNQPFYWGEIDRFEADKLLQNQPEGTFLLRNSIQDDFLFAVSFRKGERTLHARIEQKDHFFSFASHDPGFYKSNTVCGLIEFYKHFDYPMFFEPTLTRGLNRNFPFSLQHLCRAVICSNLKYDSINRLHLPRKLCTYLREYHYKQQVRVKKFEDG